VVVTGVVVEFTDDGVLNPWSAVQEPTAAPPAWIRNSDGLVGLGIRGVWAMACQEQVMDTRRQVTPWTVTWGLSRSVEFVQELAGLDEIARLEAFGEAAVYA
jgi:hypothetical protein